MHARHLALAAALALFAAVVIEGVTESHVVKYCPPPKLVLITMIGKAGLSFLCVTHQSHAATMSAVVALSPAPLVIFSAYSLAPGATPPM